MAKESKDVTRVTVKLVTELVEKVDDYARRMGINRTSAISVLLNQALMQENGRIEKE